MQESGSHHRCNAYCRPPEHCDVVFVHVAGKGDDFSSYDVTARFTKSGRAKVTRVEKARDLPPGYWEEDVTEWLHNTPEEDREAMRQHLERFYKERSWLVWWIGGE